jgi:hypothetical protein
LIDVIAAGKLDREGSVEPVTFTEEFSALEQKSLNQIIATKIHKELSELRSRVDTSPTISKRSVWELIQNGKDVNVGGKVAVRIEADLEDPDAHVTFRHNGGAFSVENIRFLIEQVSSKSRTKDSTGRLMTTGRFGTGFLTTHLLSPYVIVVSPLRERLVERVLSEWSGAKNILHLVYPTPRGILPSVRSLIDHLLIHVSAWLQEGSI